MPGMAAGRGSAARPLLAGVLLLFFFLQVLSASRIKTPTFDEPAHIGAGLSYLKTGEFKVNLQHPPLLKEIGALPLLLLGVRWPITGDEWSQLGERPPLFFQWQLGQDVIFGSGPDRVMFWSRLPFILLSTLLGFVIYAWGRRILGGAAALGALAIFTLDPNIVAHAPLVTTDVGFALFAVLFVFALWHYLNHRSLKRLLWCGLALGAALASKFSALGLLPIGALLLFWATLWIPSAVPALPSTIADPYASADWGQRIVWSVYALLAILAVAAVVIHALYFFPSNPFLYIEGIRRINADHDPTYWPYMAGTFRPRFWSYYLVAYALKEPIPILVLVGVGLWALLRRGGATVMDRAFLLVPPASLLLAYSLLSDNLGIRYLIPAFPFLHLVGGAGLAALLKDGPAWRRLAAVGLCVWLLLASAGIYPDHLSYFNEAACLLKDPSRLGRAGGTGCGPLWLDDSNVDWGQGLKQLKAWLGRYPERFPLRLAYFGSIRPESYGFVYDRITTEDLLRPPSPGLYAVSAHMVARGIGRLAEQYGDGPGNWLLHTRPTAIVGHAYYVYDVPRRPDE
jgi:dolichyl-phosphate-mannose-protein mannosyltransferase